LKVLLTGASGFVGSHILDKLREHQLPTAVLLRTSSDTQFVKSHLADAEVRSGSIDDPPALLKALARITHIIHCAGRTKAVRVAEFYQTNHLGTKNLLNAINSNSSNIQRLVHISSLAAFGPATPAHPAVENDQPHPVSHYGKSKLAAELEVQQHCRVPFTILRPPAVYGPRDTGFFSMFKAVKNHLLPRPNKTQALSLAYVTDLAENVVACLLNPATAGRTYFVASPDVVTGRSMAEEIAAQMKRWTIPLPIPSIVLWAVCLLQQAVSQITRRARLLNLQKYAELRAPGWVCSPLRLEQEAGLVCKTTLSQGIAQTLDWYIREHWL
jgi:nucleoside-diphosphate-sugar epimerase